MKRQEDLDKYNDDLQWDKLADRIMWTICIIVMLLVAEFAYRSWKVGELMWILGIV